MPAPRKITAEGKELLAAVRQYLAASYLPDARVADCAETFGVGRVRFQEKLRTAGSTWNIELAAERKRRFEAAAYTGPTKSAGHYAERCGYADETTFLRAFRDWYGVAFSEWKAQRNE